MNPRTAVGLRDPKYALLRKHSIAPAVELSVVFWLLTDSVATAAWNRWCALLDRSERERSARLFFQQDRLDFVASHALLRVMLSRFADQPPHHWTFSIDARGKPKIAAQHNCPDLHFNISHSRGLVAAAVASHEIGIDVERICTSGYDDSLAKRYFAATEIELLQGMPETERAVGFTRLWTLKEAYLKAMGIGLEQPLNSFAFELEPPRLRGADGDPRGWSFATLLPTDQHVLSVAIRAFGDRLAPILVQRMTQDDF